MAKKVDPKTKKKLDAKKVDPKTKKKLDAKKKNDSKKRRFSLVRYFKETGNELKKVNWPTRKSLISYSLAVLAFIAITAVIIGGADFALGLGLKAITTK